MKTARQQNISFTPSQNPFNTGSPARGEGFFGRSDIILSILSFLINKNENNFSVFGQRRIGKTSLLRKLQGDEDVANLAFPVYFNLQDKAKIQLPELLPEIAGRIVTDLELDINAGNFENSNAGPYFIKTFIPLVCRSLKNKKQLLLLFDEFDVLGESDDIVGDAQIESMAYKRFIPFMVALIEEVQVHGYPVKFVFAIGRNYKDLDQKRFGQITKFGPQQEISYFSLKETKTFIKEFSDNIIPFSRKAIDEINILTAGHPYFTQCLASAAFDKAEKNGKKRISPRMVRAEFIPALKRYSSGILWVWDSLSDSDQIVLYLMAVLIEKKKCPIDETSIKEKAFALEIAPAVEDLPETLSRLSGFSFIKENDTMGPGYRFCVEFIRKWIVREISEAEIIKKLDTAVDEDVRFHLHNARHFFKRKDYKQAVVHYQEILEKSQYHFEALLYLGRSYVNLKEDDEENIDKALDAYNRAYRLNKQSTEREYLDLLQEKYGQEAIEEDVEAVLKYVREMEAVEPDTKGAKETKKMRILLVEDDVFLSHLLGDELKSEGFEVTAARTLSDAKKTIISTAFDAAILDIRFPVGKRNEIDPDELLAAGGGFRSGFVLAEWINRYYPDIFLVAYSNTTFKEGIERFQEIDGRFFSKMETRPSSLVKYLRKALWMGKAFIDGPKCLIVHGRDRVLLYQLKNYLQNYLCLPEPITLHDLPDFGRTVIEKFEEASLDIELVFILLTPDDKVSDTKVPNDEKRRARQNIIFEMGYFLGKIPRKRGRVILLHKRDLELPSDIQGLIYIDISNGIEAVGEQIRKEIADFLPSER